MERRKSFKVGLKGQRIAALPKIVSIKLNRKKSSSFSPHDSCEEDEDDEMLQWRRSVPQGHVAVYAAKEKRKMFVIPVCYLKHPVFRELLGKAEEKFGFNYHDGRLTIPCEPSVLDGVIQMLREGDALDISCDGYSTPSSSSDRRSLFSDVHNGVVVR